MKKIDWHLANSADFSIIAYGDVEGKRMFKITQNSHNEKYSAWKYWAETGYQTVHNHAITVDEAKKHCNYLTS